MRIFRRWKYHHLVKRGGIGMLPGGISTAPDRSCAIECPACPHPESRPTGLSHGELTDEDSETGYVPFFAIRNPHNFSQLVSDGLTRSSL